MVAIKNENTNPHCQAEKYSEATTLQCWNSNNPPVNLLFGVDLAAPKWRTAEHSHEKCSLHSVLQFYEERLL